MRNETNYCMYYYHVFSVVKRTVAATLLVRSHSFLSLSVGRRFGRLSRLVALHMQFMHPARLSGFGSTISLPNTNRSSML